MAEQALRDMLQKLIEDRQKRDQTRERTCTTRKGDSRGEGEVRGRTLTTRERGSRRKDATRKG